MYLFRSDLALIMYDWLSRQPELKQNLSTILNARNADQRVANALTSIANYCQNIGARDRVEVDESREREFNNLLSEERVVSETASFIIDYLDHPTQEVVKEKAAEAETKAAKAEGAGVVVAEGEAAPTAGVPTPTAAVTAGGGVETGELGGELVPPVITPETPQPVDVLALKQKIFSREVREQVVRFTQISLTQLEIFHRLPPGSLQNSPELREVLSQKALAFFTTTLSQERFDLLLSSPEERFRFIRQFLWLTQNDVRVSATIERHLYNVVLKNADPATKQQIEQALIAAEKGEDNPSELIRNLAEDPAVRNVVEALRQTNAFTSEKAAEKFQQTLLQDLQQYLLAVGVTSDKLILARENILNVLQVWTQNGVAADILTVVDEPRFREIFGPDIPYNPQLLENLKTFWIVWRADLAKQTDNILLSSEVRFASQEALDLLDKKNTQNINEAQKTKLFQVIVSQPTQHQIEDANRDQTTIQTGTKLGDSRQIEDNLKENQQAFLQSVWDSLSSQQRETFSQFYGYEIVTLDAPVEFTIHSSFIVGEESPLAYYAQVPGQLGEGAGAGYMPDNALIHSPLTRVNTLHQQLGKLGDLTKLAKRFTGRLAGSKTGEQALEKIAQTAGSKLPGGPVTGWIAKQAVTKKGRKRLALIGLSGGLSLLIPLQTIGGWLGGLAGGVIGWFAGGALGAAIGGYLGSWVGFGVESWLTGAWNSVFGSGGGAGAAAGGAGAALPPIQAAGAGAGGGELAAQAIASTGTQAVLTTVGIVVAGTLFSHMVVSNALLADFPQVDPLTTTVPGANAKQSEYVTIEKRIFITGCPENKCENPAFPITAEYSIVIRPKDDYAITIREVTDTLKVNTSEKAWEEEGKNPPDIPDRVKTIDDFPELYDGLTIEPGSEFAFSYTETFDEKYNHSSIVNTFELAFDYNSQTSGETGSDNAITGEIIYVGNYDQGAGCWPASGTVTQLPGGSYSHTNADAFDIANVEGTPIYAPFAGTACSQKMDYSIYGNNVVLAADDGRSYVFGHMRSKPFEGCREVQPGAVLGPMGSTGASSGSHVHFGLIGGYSGVSVLATLMPNGTSVQENDPVRSCYDQL